MGLSVAGTPLHGFAIAERSADHLTLNALRGRGGAQSCAQSLSPKSGGEGGSRISATRETEEIERGPWP
jgi:hypothetical protein